MSSSTKTYGAGIARTSQTRSAAEATTIPASHAQSGTRATRARHDSSTEVDLGEPSRDLGGLGRAGCDADLGRGIAHLADDAVRDWPTACDHLERGRLPVGDTAEIVLGRGELPGRGTHRRTRVRPLGEELQRRREVWHLVVADGNPERDAVRQLAEPADVGDDERLAEGERPDRRAGRLAH